jgi:hypothetical protein
LKQLLQKHRLIAGDFAAGKRAQSHDFYAPCQRVSHGWQQQDIGRPGKDKTTGLSVLINTGLKAGKQAGGALYFIQDGFFGQCCHKTNRIRLCRSQLVVVIQTDVVVAKFAANRLRQRGFATLTRSMDQDNGRILQGCAQSMF